MSHSTTTTSQYVLLKYSRSYPQSPQENNPEWQHYTKPVIKLTLDVKKSSNTGELESVFLRIAWTMENAYPQDQNELIFENFDMLTFSSLPPRQDRQGGLPLKAVYRDSVVGIRYLDLSNGIFRRFQITFQSNGHASEFTDAISSVCPCKPNATAGAQTYNIAGPSIAPANLLQPSALPHPNFLRSGPSPPHADMSPTSGFSHRLSSYPTAHFQHPGVPYASGIPMASSPAQPLSSSPPLPPPSGQSPFLFGASQLSSSYTPAPEQRPYYSPSSSVDPTVPFTHASVSTEPSSKPKTETFEKEVQTSDQFLFALQEATSLYHMSHSSLEKLVGDVVREDGFVHLMESLSSMWKVKGYVG